MKNITAQNRILIVSDDLSFRESLSQMLESASFTTVSGGHGRDAIRMLRAKPVKAIVLDYKTSLDRNGGASQPSETLVAITDIHPFVPLVLTCEPDSELDHQTTMMADLVLRHPVTSSALLGGIDLQLAETLRDRARRKSEYMLALR